MCAAQGNVLSASDDIIINPSIPMGVLMGNTGAGKTTLSNKICGTDHKVEAARGSCTRELFQNLANCGTYPFSIIDTPGVDSQVETYKHAHLLKEALTGTPINTIFFVIKYDNRYDRMLLEYAKLLIPVQKYSEKIVTMVSHMDVSKDREKDETIICEIFDDEYHVSNFIFYSDQDDSSGIVDRMHRYASKMKAVALQISDEEFNLNFNIYQVRARISGHCQAFLDKTKQIKDDYANLIKDMCSANLATQEKDELLHMCIVSFKNELDSITEEFIKTHGADMTELDSFGFLVMMQKEKIKLCNEFTQSVSVMMSYSLLDSSDPRNLIKRCPHCGEIWFKVAGCEGSTTCGKRPTDKLYDVLTTPWWRFTFKRVGRIIQWEKLDMGTARQAQPRDTTSKGIGCGKAFEWIKQPPIEEEKIKELFHVKTIEEVKEIIRRTDYVQMRRQYENNIDKKRYI